VSFNHNFNERALTLGALSHSSCRSPPKDNSTLLKKSVSYSPLSAVLDRSNWSLSHSESAKGGSPFRGLTRHSTKERSPNDVLGILGQSSLSIVSTATDPKQRCGSLSIDTTICPRAKLDSVRSCCPSQKS
jgi:hypothetical protein